MDDETEVVVKTEEEIEGLKSALQAERKKRQEVEALSRGLETSLAELKGRVEGIGTKPDKPLTRQQLREAVDEGKISQDEADSLWEQQVEARLSEKIEQKLTSRLNSTTIESRVSEEIKRYKDVVEGLDDTESAAFKKVSDEFRHLVSLGYDQSELKTEIVALRAAFGPIDTLEKSAKPRERESHSETGGRGADPKSNGGWPSAMSAKQRAYYEQQIAKGLIDQKGAIEEFNYKPKHGRAA